MTNIFTFHDVDDVLGNILGVVTDTLDGLRYPQGIE
jgi:hypothetical protein